jgi:hypothetical protein
MKILRIQSLFSLSSYLLIIAMMPHKIRRTPLTRIQEVFSSNLGRDIRYPAEIFLGFLSPSTKIPTQHLD